MAYRVSIWYIGSVYGINDQYMVYRINIGYIRSVYGI